MGDDNIYQNLTQLGGATAMPQSPEAAELERVPNPQADLAYNVRFTAPEFTSLCPMTGQPDFAHLVIDYVPGQWLVESKSLKLYLDQLPQPRRVPRGLHPVDRAAAGGCPRAAMAAHRRLLVPARRHPDRCLLADRSDARRASGFPTRAYRPIAAAAEPRPRRRRRGRPPPSALVDAVAAVPGGIGALVAGRVARHQRARGGAAERRDHGPVIIGVERLGRDEAQRAAEQRPAQLALLIGGRAPGEGDQGRRWRG